MKHRSFWVAKALALLPLALLLGFGLAGDAAATGLTRKHGLPAQQANDVLGIEPGMQLVEVRKALARRFPIAFVGCLKHIEGPRQLNCRATREAYYEEVVGRALPTGTSATTPYISNLVMTVTEPDAKRSIEVFFGSDASGGEAYRISGVIHYEPIVQPLIAAYEREFTAKYGPMETTIKRGRGTIARAFFQAGTRLNSSEAEDQAQNCQDLLLAAAQMHDIRAMAARGFARQVNGVACDTMIVLSMAPGIRPDQLGISTVVVFDAARAMRMYEVETSAAAAHIGMNRSAGQRPARDRDF